MSELNLDSFFEDFENEQRKKDVEVAMSNINLNPLLEQLAAERKREVQAAYQKAHCRYCGVVVAAEKCKNCGAPRK